MPELPCAFHPDRLTLVSCTRCERPICPDDMISAPVGIQCPVCAGRMREGPMGETAYRVRTKAETVPALRMLAGKQLVQVVLAANVAVFVLMLLTGAVESATTLIRFGALVRPLPKSDLWRLFTSMFVHIGPLHLLLNMWGLMVFGPAIETRYGKLRFIGLYLSAGLLGAAASMAFNTGPGIAAGASGGVFGILGAWIAFFFRYRTAPGARDQLRSLMILVGINLAFGFSGSRVDNFAHLGGLVGGFVIVWMMEISKRAPARNRTLVALSGWLVVVAVAAVLVMPRTCTPGTIVRFGDGTVVPCTVFTSGEFR